MDYNHFFSFEDLPLLWQSTVGIERESTRVDQEGNLSQLNHPREWGSRNHQPYIQTDFAESQLEFITPPHQDADQLINWLAAEHQIVSSFMTEHHELLWPFSTPAVIPSDREEISVAQLDNPKELAYREYLAEHYGKDVQLISGIHYNFQINPDLIASKSKQTDLVELQNQVYMKLARNYLRYRWVLTYLLGAAPYIEETYSTHLYGKPHTQIMRSFRQSRYGYNNSPDIQISYESLEAFVRDLEATVHSGQFIAEKELYQDVRLRRGNPTRELLDKGITYLEFRNIDINPYSPYGINSQTIDFIRLFLISLLFIDDVLTDEQVALGTQLNEQTAESHPFDGPIDLDEAQSLLQHVLNLAKHLDQALGQDSQLANLVEDALEQVARPEATLAGRLLQDMPKPEDFSHLGLDLARQHQKIYLKRPYSLHGFEAFELSTQDLIKEAMASGIEVEVIDVHENIIALTYQDQKEYIKSANMTSRDSLISYFLMENKLATKQLLDQAGVPTPAGYDFNQLQEAIDFYPLLADGAWVIKPNNTNYGIGITIFSKKPSKEDYVKALELAFAEDKTVLIEEFISGTELRFYIQDGQVLAICERQPAQVIADGSSTISQLIDQANQDPLRGPSNKAPLKFIDKGEIESLQLAEQGYDFDSVPASGQVIYLRRNSNISTGGLSIDRTDQVHDSYKQMAVKASQALGAYFCGVDILIDDYQEAARPDNFGVIEANFNPMMVLHRFSGRGTHHRLARHLLEDFFPQAFDY
ncbi:bifunctional glutamate--cysteine ligase GshA/glutathione synthetase GshB [Hutsoniella sourekii]|uniref:bifunctional glutamate--cysteine ligase GshA/glutathione synthetase GshB n=1 Tax=Hutsoniella sourekii TaxID=87650 RepID=UPI000486A8BE|nr:bifunctional glutamate--cysteine ligase GshA/glutathione synthetase GshB [Hutsoniella sourekii]